MENKTKEKEMATFYNQATLRFNGGLTSSNITEGAVNSALTISKEALTEDYTTESLVVYLITVTNPTATEREGVTITDNLGTFTASGELVTPLDYVDGSAMLITNGVSEELTADAVDGILTFGAISIPPSSSVNIIYTARVNSSAPLAEGSVITNTATSECTDEGASASITVRNTVALTIAKAICPSNVSCGERVSYTFIIQNTGNTEASDGVIVSDTFNPTLSDIEVTLDGETLSATSYSYDELTGVFTTEDGAITIPAATFTQGEGGIVTTTPGVTVLTVSGIIG